MIFGKNIRLRFIERADLPRFVEWFSDPEVRRYLEPLLGFSAELEQTWFENNARQAPEDQALAIDVKQRGAWKHVGSTSFFKIDHRVRSAEIGILVGDKSQWDRGVGTDVMRTMIAHGFQTLNLNRIYLRVYAGNARAMKVYERVGFIREGTMREGEFREGAYTDVHLYSILRREWEALRGKGKEK